MLATQVLPEDTLDNAADELEIVGHLLIDNQRHEIRRGENRIGRDPCCSIVIENCTISKLHAVIESEGRDDTFIYDCGSTNLTKLKKAKLKPYCRYKLDDGTDLLLGNVVATFVSAPKRNFLELTAIPVNTQALEELDDIFDLPTQVTFAGPSTIKDVPKPSDSHKIPNSVSHNKKEFRPSDSGFSGLENSKIFNLDTQCQLPKLTEECNNEKVKSLLNDGQDDVLCNFMSQHSPKCDDETEIDIFDVSTQVDSFGNEDLNTIISDGIKESSFKIFSVKQKQQEKLVVLSEGETEIYDAEEEIKNVQIENVVFTQQAKISESEIKEHDKSVVNQRVVLTENKAEIYNVEKEIKEAKTDVGGDIFTQQFKFSNSQTNALDISTDDEEEDSGQKFEQVPKDNKDSKPCGNSQELISFQVCDTKLVEFSEHIESILSNDFKDETKPDNSGDETVSDLEMDSERNIFIEEVKAQPEISESQDSNDSYTFEVDPKRPETDSDATHSEIEFQVNNEETQVPSPTLCNVPKDKLSPSPKCWSPLSLEMPSTQDVKSTVDKFLRGENQVGNEQVDSPLKRNRPESIDDSLAKKPKTDGRLTKLWQVHDVAQIQPTRTRYSLRTPNTNKQSCRRSARGRKSNPEITPYLVRCRRKKETPKESTRVLRGRKSENFDTPKKRKTKVIAFTGFESAKLGKIIDELGGGRTNDLSSASVVVADKVRRTVKFLCAVGLGLSITSPEWLLTSRKEKKFVNPTSFILKDEEAEDKWGFDLKSSLERSKKVKLLEGYSVFATKSTKPPVKDLLAIVECCGGTPIFHKPTTWPRKTIIVSCEEDKEAWPPPRVRNIKLVHYEFILTGVLRQKIDFKSYNLR